MLCCRTDRNSAWRERGDKRGPRAERISPCSSHAPTTLSAFHKSLRTLVYVPSRGVEAGRTFFLRLRISSLMCLVTAWVAFAGLRQRRKRCGGECHKWARIINSFDISFHLLKTTSTHTHTVTQDESHQRLAFARKDFLRCDAVIRTQYPHIDTRRHGVKRLRLEASLRSLPIEGQFFMLAEIP